MWPGLLITGGVAPCWLMFWQRSNDQKTVSACGCTAESKVDSILEVFPSLDNILLQVFNFFNCYCSWLLAPGSSCKANAVSGVYEWSWYNIGLPGLSPTYYTKAGIIAQPETKELLAETSTGCQSECYFHRGRSSLHGDMEREGREE